MEVKCYNKKCLHEWDYRGETEKFVCCPKCRFKRILSKCRGFFLSKNDIPKNRPNNIPTYKKEIVQPQIEKVDKSHFTLHESKHKDKIMTFTDGTQVLIPRPEMLVPMFENCSPMNEELEENLEEESNSHFSELPTNFCKEHGLHAHYDSLEKKWLCGKCPESQIEINSPFKKYTKNLGTVKEIEKPNLNMSSVGFDPLKTLNNQGSFF